MSSSQITQVEHPSMFRAQPDQRLYYRAKRLLDLTLSILGLIVLAPVMLVIAVLIKLDSPGPVFFLQKRVGARLVCAGTGWYWQVGTFEMCKFRSMVHNADASIHEAHVKAFVNGEVTAPDNGNGARFKLNNDARITRVGKFLRRTSLDELPQLFNVLRGEMSLVGPRPVPTYEVEHYQSWHKERLATLPGITGLWQVTGRCALSFDDMVRLDLDYIRAQSLGGDIKIILLTIPAVLTGRGAG